MSSLAEHTREIEAILAEQTRRSPFEGIHARGSLLVRPVRLRDAQHTAWITRAPGSSVLLPVDEDYLRLETTRLARLQRYDKRAARWFDVDAPTMLARGLLAAAPWHSLPVLQGIIEAPTLRPDGSLLESPGYDVSTGLLFDPGGRPTATIATVASRIRRWSGGAS